MRSLESRWSLAAAGQSRADIYRYPQDVQDIVRACEFDIVKIYNLIQSTVEFQPYFGFLRTDAVGLCDGVDGSCLPWFSDVVDDVFECVADMFELVV